MCKCTFQKVEDLTRGNVQRASVRGVSDWSARGAAGRPSWLVGVGTADQGPGLDTKSSVHPAGRLDPKFRGLSFLPDEIACNF